MKNKYSKSHLYLFIHFFVFNSESHFSITSNLFWLLADTLKHATVLSLNVFNSIFSTTSSSVRQPSRSFLLPSTNKGIPAKLLFCNSSCNWVFANSILALLIQLCTLIWRVYHKYYHIRISAEFLPWFTKTGLASQVPQLHWYFSYFYFIMYLFWFRDD